MKLYTFYTDTHKEFYEKYFLPSFQKFNEFDIIPKKVNQIGNGMCGTAGFNQLMNTKMDIMIKGIQDNMGEIFVYMDCDIQVFTKIKEDCLAHLGERDLLFQTNCKNRVNAGIIFCKGSNKTLNYFKKVRRQMNYNKRKIIADQDIINKTIDRYRMSYRFLPKHIYVGGYMVLRKKDKDTKMIVAPPKNIKLHHSTCLWGVENKLVQMEYVKMCMDGYSDGKTEFPKWFGYRQRGMHKWKWVKS